ncbi:MAG TPA: SWIM zinc finger family protein [Caulobacter sp.]|nr:SWIM zinc finger family protein [Caulobacter sp.]
MNAPDFDYEAVRRDMPEARVMRGEAYAAKGWVALVEVSPAGVLAHVTGERGIAYVVEVAARDASDARCTCPDFEESGLRCKHVVATVFTVLDTDDAGLAAAAGRLARLADQLDMEGRDDALLLVDRARRDPALLRELEGDPVI